MGSEIHRGNHLSWALIGRLRVDQATFKNAQPGSALSSQRPWAREVTLFKRSH